MALAIGISPVASHAVGDATIPADVWGLAGRVAKELLVGMLGRRPVANEVREEPRVERRAEGDEPPQLDVRA